MNHKKEYLDAVRILADLAAGSGNPAEAFNPVATELVVMTMGNTLKCTECIGKATIAEASVEFCATCDAKGLEEDNTTWHTAARYIEQITLIAKARNWMSMTKLISDGLPKETASVTAVAAAAVVAEEPKKKQRRKVPTAPFGYGNATVPAREIGVQTIVVQGVAPTPPVIVPGDPMASMARGMEPHLAPAMHALAGRLVAELATKVTEELKRIVKEVEAPLAFHVPAAAPAVASAPGVDKKAVEEIVNGVMAATAGDEAKRHLKDAAPALMAELLTKAADAVGSMAGSDPEKVVLYAAQTPVEDPLYRWPDDVQLVAEMLNSFALVSPQNAILAGPTGAGKTTFSFQFAARYNRKVMVMDCANLRESRDWFGVKGAENGRTYFRKSQFWMAVEAGHCVILLDEFNRASESVRNPLMPLLDDRRRSFVEEVGEFLVVGPNVVFIATLNEGSAYTGTYTTDRALSGRFPIRIELGYLPEDEEQGVLLDKAPGLSKDDARKLVEVASAVRQKVLMLNGGISQPISTRQLIAAAKSYVSHGPKTLQFTIFSHYPADDGANSERAQVVKTFELKGFRGI